MTEPATFADLRMRLGGIPLDRIVCTPQPGSATEADLVAAWYAPHRRPCELIEGTLVERPGTFAGSVMATFLGFKLGRHVEERDAGVLLDGVCPIRLGPGIIRRPSLSFTPWDRLPNEELPDEEIASFVPTLMIDLRYRWNTTAEFGRKTREYFAAGCVQVWVIDPDEKSARVYTASDRFHDIDHTCVLDGEPVLPGFRLPLADVFAAIHRKK
jgi:Uma2 family endonuclease